MIDTNGDPDVVDYVIPCNDDAMRSIRLFVSASAEACISGVQSGREAFARDFQGVATAADTAAVEVVRKPRKAAVAEEAPAAEAKPEGDDA